MTTDEAEQACAGQTVFLDSDVVDGEIRVESIGSTKAGRILKLVTTDRDELIRVVTAFEANRSLKQAFLQLTGQNYE